MATALLLAACGFQPISADGDGGAADASSDLAGVDSAPGSEDGPTATDGGGGPCPLPHLLVSVYNGANGALTGGAVMRLPLAGGAVAGSCASLTGGGQLGALVHSAAFIAPGGVAVAWNGGVALLDGATDSMRWSYALPNAPFPVDVFPLVANSETFVAVGYNVGAAQSQIETLELYRQSPPPVAPAFKWKLDGVNFPVGNVFGVTQSPLAANHVFMLVVGPAPFAASDVDPLVPVATKYADYPTTTKLAGIYALPGTAPLRAVWVDTNTNGLAYVSDPGGAPTVRGPVTCAAQSCTLKHAVPDPTDANGFFALCASTSGSHLVSVLKLSTAGACSVVLDGATLPADRLLTRLAVAK